MSLGRRRVVSTIGLCLILLVTPVAGVTTAADANGQSSDLELTASAPDSATVGDSVSIGSTVTLPDVLGSYETEVTVSLYVAGDEVAEKTVTASDGESTNVTFQHSFEESGSKTVTIRASATYAGGTYSGEKSTTVDVESVGEEMNTTGVVFETPESLEDEVNETRDSLGLGSQVQAFVLGKADELHLVFTTTNPETAEAHVIGRETDKNLSYEGQTLNVAVASSVEYDPVGTATTVEAVERNPDEYRLDLVRISTQHRRISVLADPDDGSNFTASTTVGALVANPTSTSAVYEDAVGSGRRLAEHPNRTTVRRILDNPEEPYLPTFSLETKYWTDSRATVDGIVLNPASQAYAFASTLDSNGLLGYAEDPDTPVLYVAQTQFDTQEFDSVRDVAANADSLDGQIIEVDGRMYQSRLSIQETAEHATVAQCNNETVPVQTPQGAACVNLPADVLVEAGVLWTTVPESRDDVMPVVGFSSRHQDEPLVRESGRYELTGEVISTSRINESLPNGSILVLHRAKKTGEIDYEAVAGEAKQLIEEREGAFRNDYRTRIVGSESRDASTGIIAGRVIDQNDDEIAGAAVTVLDAQTEAVVETAVTDSQGEYAVEVPADTEYTIEVEFEGAVGSGSTTVEENRTSEVTTTVSEESSVSRFDTNAQVGIQISEVLTAISAFNDGSDVDGEPVSLKHVLAVISAYNTGGSDSTLIARS